MWRKGINKLRFHPDKPVSWLPTHQRSDWLLKHGIASTIDLRAFARENCIVTGINELKIIIFVLYYLTVLVYTKTTIHL